MAKVSSPLRTLARSPSSRSGANGPVSGSGWARGRWPIARSTGSSGRCAVRCSTAKACPRVRPVAVLSSSMPRSRSPSCSAETARCQRQGRPGAPYSTRAEAGAKYVDRVAVSVRRLPNSKGNGPSSQSGTRANSTGTTTVRDWRTPATFSNSGPAGAPSPTVTPPPLGRTSSRPPDYPRAWPTARPGAGDPAEAGTGRRAGGVNYPRGTPAGPRGRRGRSGRRGRRSGSGPGRTR